VKKILIVFSVGLLIAALFSVPMIHKVKADWAGYSWGVLDSVSMINEDDGWAVGSQGEIVHWDGINWTEYESSVYQDLYSVCMINETDGWIGGYFGTVLRWNGTDWNDVSEIYDLGDTHSFVMVDENDGWAVGSSIFGTIHRWDGTNWTDYGNTVTIDSPTHYQLQEVCMVDENDGWAVGYAMEYVGANNALRWNGTNWNLVQLPINTTLYSVSMVSADDGWAVGDYGKILHWNGSSWNEFPSPMEDYYTNSLLSVRMIDADNGWAVGGNLGAEEMMILNWNGTAWNEVESPSEGYLRSVYLFNATDGWAVGAKGYGWIVRLTPTGEWIIPDLPAGIMLLFLMIFMISVAFAVKRLIKKSSVTLKKMLSIKKIELLRILR
jgi:photosystem II stability/assembly factor-like uncharacterized protein